uniref:Uncharacterized protein n=1 Tax=Anguilla anguilla TaxID=7936 RepID=A0A0E9SMJ4_ANGAN
MYNNEQLQKQDIHYLPTFVNDILCHSVSP